MFIGLVVFLVTKKKNLGLAGTFVANPLSPTEKKKVFSIIGLAIIIIAILCAIAIPTGILNFETFIGLIGILGILNPYNVLYCYVS